MLEETLALALQNHQAGNLQKAEVLYKQVLAQEKRHHVALGMLGVIAHQVGQHEWAETLLRQTIAYKPDYADAHCNLGSVLLAQGRRDEAVAQFRHAIMLRPDFAQAYGNLGNALADMQKTKDAIECYMQALTHKPDNTGVRMNLGIAYRDLGLLDQARQCFAELVAIDPYSAEAHNNLGSLLAEQFRLEEAKQSYERAVALKPDYAEALNNLGALYLDQGQSEKAQAYFTRASNMQPDYHVAESNRLFAMHYEDGHSQQTLFDAAVKWGAKHAPQSLALPAAAPDANPAKKLRIGYVSADFMKHPVGYFMLDVLRGHDRAHTEIFAYANQTKHDAMTQEIEALVNWRNIVRMGDEEAAQRIRADAIDVLIDLSGHTGGNRLRMFAYRPAPVQATWLGYFDTTGVPAMDYILCDPHVLPAALEPYFTEKPLRMPATYLCFTPPEYDISVSDLPMAENGFVTFGCFNKFKKISPPVLECWIEILHKVPGSRLSLNMHVVDDPELLAPLIDPFLRAGIARERLILQQRTTRPELLKRYRQVDVALDPYPYSGGTTTVEALWMGVPVVTFPQNLFVSRVSESIIVNTGHKEWVAQSREEYIHKAANLVKDAQALAHIRKNLRGELLSSPLCDAKTFVKNLESLYRGAWTNYCKTLASTAA